MNDFERELERTLHRVLDPITARPIPGRRAPKAQGAWKTFAGGAGAALTLKVVTGIAAAAAAVTVAGAVTTGSVNPATWGRQVSQDVSTCKSDLSGGEHGIGDCVSSFAGQHGAAVASAARHHGTAGGQGNGHGSSGAGSNGNGHGNGHGNGKTKVRTPPPHR